MDDLLSVPVHAASSEDLSAKERDYQPPRTQPTGVTNGKKSNDAPPPKAKHKKLPQVTPTPFVTALVEFTDGYEGKILYRNVATA